MKKTLIQTKVKRLLADIYTPVGIYLRLRDRYRDTILLESTDHHAAENSFSFIGINAIGGIEVTDAGYAEVDDELRGKNVGFQLVSAAVSYARQHNLKILPICPFAKSVFEKKPEYGDVLG